ncbi:antirestriction protein ArdA [Alteromonadaceae bacterium M269]|nr:antirestriction protein ArdA [Alteromonadaceae bacterium M269]
MNSDYKIYVADLAAYNSGQLHGVWIDALSDDIQDQINEMLQQSPVKESEEWAIHSYDGFEGVDLGEFESLETVQEIAAFLDEYDEFGAALLNHFCNGIDEARKAAEECYQGCYEDLADYARSITEDTTDIPSHLQYYIDYEKMGRDMDMSGDIYTIDIDHQQTHVFLNY